MKYRQQHYYWYYDCYECGCDCAYDDDDEVYRCCLCGCGSVAVVAAVAVLAMIVSGAAAAFADQSVCVVYYPVWSVMSRCWHLTYQVHQYNYLQDTTVKSEKKKR